MAYNIKTPEVIKMELMKKIKQKWKDWMEIIRIWRSKPDITFQQGMDIYEKQPILKKAFADAAEMLKRDKYMFNETCTALLSNQYLRGKSLKNKTLLDVIVREDQRINTYEQKIRGQILKYLADNSAPDVENSLVLTSVVIDLERLGDYTKDLAKLTLLQPVELRGSYYGKSIRQYKRDIMKMFKLADAAFVSGDKDKAKQLHALNKQLRKSTDEFLLKLDKDEKVTSREAINFTLYTRYFRRVAAHLENISSTAIRQFPYLGFKHKYVKSK